MKHAPVGWDPFDAAWWLDVVGDLTAAGCEWSDGAILADLRWWAARERRGEAVRPGRPALVKRWRTTDHRVKVMLKREAEWELPAEFGPRPSRVTQTDPATVGEDGDELDVGVVAQDDHRALCAVARAFLSRRGCVVALAEPPSGGAGSIPDAIGWGRGLCHMVEVKRSRSDFRRDADKVSHRSDRIVGDHRWYLAPATVLRPEDIPEGWGLVAVLPSGRLRVLVDAPRVERSPGSVRDEVIILSRIARRALDGGTLDETTGRLTTWAELQRARGGA